MIAKLKIYRDLISMSELESQHEHIKNMLDTTGCETLGRDKKSESFAFCTSLRKYRLIVPIELPPQVKKALI